MSFWVRGFGCYPTDGLWAVCERNAEHAVVCCTFLPGGTRAKLERDW